MLSRQNEQGLLQSHHMEQTNEILMEPVVVQPAKELVVKDVVKPVESVAPQSEKMADEKEDPREKAMDAKETAKKKEPVKKNETSDTNEQKAAKATDAKNMRKEVDDPKEKPLPNPMKYILADQETAKLQEESKKKDYKVLFQDLYQKVKEGKMSVSDLYIERGILMFLLFIVRFANKVLNRFTKKESLTAGVAKDLLDDSTQHLSMMLSVYSSVISAVEGDFSAIQQYAKPDREQQQALLQQQNESLAALGEDMQHPLLIPFISEYDSLENKDAQAEMLYKLNQGSAAEKVAAQCIGARSYLTSKVAAVTQTLVQINNLTDPTTFTPLPKKGFMKLVKPVILAAI